MTETLKSFFDTLPKNHWSRIAIMLLTLFFIVYSVYFYFSKEGKDERGKKIISTASFTTFIVTMIMLWVLSNVFYDIASYNQFSYYWVSNIVVLLLSATEAFGIMILKKVI